MREATTTHRVSRAGAAVLLAASTLTIMAAAIVSPSLPAIQTAFPDAAPVVVRQVVTLTSAAIAVTAPFTGILLRRVGSRFVLSVGLVIYVLAGTAGLWTPGLLALLASRVALGIAVGMIMTAVSATIAGLWSGPARGRMMAGQQAFASLGGVVFIPLAGLLAPLGWRIPFLLYGAALLVLPFALAVPLLPGRRTTQTLPEPGRRASAPLVILVLSVAVIGTAVFFMAPTQLPFLLDEAGLPPVFAGVAIAASTATGVIGALLFPTLRRRLDFGAIAAYSLLMLGIGWIVIGSSGSGAPIGVITGALIGGIGVGAIVPDLNAWISDIVEGPRRATALGGLVAAIFGGQFLSPLLLAPFIDAIGLRGTFVGAAVVLAILAAAVVIISRHTQNKKRKDRMMIYHGNRFTMKKGVTPEQRDEALDSLRNQGASIDAVKSYVVGPDFGGEFEYGAVFVIEDLEGYWEYLMAPSHAHTDRIGLPLLEKFQSFDITDDPDPDIEDKIAELHRRRYAQNAELTQLVRDLPLYEGSGSPE